MARHPWISNAKLAVPALLASLALAGCATGGYPSSSHPGSSYPGGVYDPGGYGSQYGSQRFIATVQGVDARNGRLLLDVGDPRSSRMSRIEVLFDNRTVLVYQGRQYPMAGLERGDEISVEAVESRGRLWATRVDVVRNVRDYGGGYRY